MSEMPASVAAEKSVLGAILLSPACYHETRELTPEHFSLDSHRRIYKAMTTLAYFGKQIDTVMLMEALGPQDVGGLGYLASLTDGVTTRGLASHIAVLSEKKQLRQIIRQAQMALDAAMECSPSAEVLETLRDGIDGIVNQAPETNRELFTPVGAFMQQAQENIQWRVKGIIATGTSGFVLGSPKSAKTPLVGALAVALATGDDFLEFPTTRCRVALVSREDAPDTTASWLKRYMRGRGFDPNGGYLDEWLWVNTRRESKHLMLDNQAELASLIKNLQRRKTEFLILDVLNVLHDKDENDNGEMRSVLRRIEQIRDEVGCQVCIVHHTRKNVDEETPLVEAARGSSAISGFAEFMLGLYLVDEETHTRKVRFVTKGVQWHFPLYWRIRDLPTGGGVVVERVDFQSQKPRRAAQAR